MPVCPTTRTDGPTWPRLAATLALVATLALGACDEDLRRIGAPCASSSACQSGLCAAGRCLDPAADEDQDGLINGFEAHLGSDPTSADTDGDGIPDGQEVGAGEDTSDSDGDGIPDVLESMVLDDDEDCLPNQLDARNAEPDSDLSPLIPTVCRTEGICAGRADELAVECPGGGDPVCGYDGIEGFSAPESACDGVDEDCDGVVDGPWSGDCGGAVRPWQAAGSGSAQIETSMHRAVLAIGAAPLGAVETDRHRALIGATPDVTPSSPQETP